MRIVCEKCAAEYNLDDRRIPDGGMELKCPKCLHAFLVTRAGPAAPAAPAAPPGAPAGQDPAGQTAPFSAPAAAGQWFLLRANGQTYGPFDTEDLVRMASSGRLDPTEQISQDKASWQPVGTVQPFATALGQ